MRRILRPKICKEKARIWLLVIGCWMWPTHNLWSLAMVMLEVSGGDLPRSTIAVPKAQVTSHQ